MNGLRTTACPTFRLRRNGRRSKSPPKQSSSCSPPDWQPQPVGEQWGSGRPHSHGPAVGDMSGAVELGQIRMVTSLSTGTYMNSTTGPAPNRIRIWQQNLNKSRATHEDLINSDIYKSFDVLVLQEPYMDKLGNTKATRDWRVAYLSSHLTGNRPT